MQTSSYTENDLNIKINYKYDKICVNNEFCMGICGLRCVAIL